MPIRFRCEQCARSLSVPRRYAGKDARCPKCQAQLSIPSSHEEAISSAAEVQARSASEIAVVSSGSELAAGPLSPGARLADRYEVTEVLGEGGMGIVYAVRDLELEGQAIALKLIRPELTSVEGARARFRKEIATARQLRHPQIVQVYDLGEDAERGVLFYTMERLPGPSLREHIASHPGGLPYAEARSIFEDILSAVTSLHQKGVIHRDLKPGNIMLDAGGRPVLVDFGLAKVLEADGDGPIAASLVTELGRTRAGLGSPRYAAPEQQESGAEASARSDVFSLGVILYELLTGERPVGAFDPVSALRPEASEELDAVLRRALKGKPEQRFASAEALRDALLVVPLRAAATEPEAKPAARPKLAKEAARPLARRSRPSPRAEGGRRPLLLGALAVAVLGLGLLFFALLRPAPLAIVELSELPDWVSEDQLTITGRLSQGGAAVVIGGAATVSDSEGRFAITTALTEGENRLSLELVGSGGGRLRRELVTRRDSSPPILTGLSLSREGRFLIFRGRVEEAHLAALSLDDDALELPVDGQVRLRLHLSRRLWWLRARDKAGNRASLPIRAPRDSAPAERPEAPPAVAPRGSLSFVRLPASPLWSKDGRLTLRGQVSEPYAAIRVGPVQAMADRNGDFAINLVLVETRTELPLRALAQSGSQARASLTAVIDDMPPRLTINGLAEGRLDIDESVIEGKILEPHLASATVNDEDLKVEARGLIRIDCKDEEGCVELVFLLTDKAGNETRQEFEIWSPKARAAEAKREAERLQRERALLETIVAAGGGKDTDRAVLGALAWLARHQSPAGNWDCGNWQDNCSRGRCAGPGRNQGDDRYDVGVTGLALLAFFGRGYDQRSGPYQSEIKAGLKWLMNQQAPSGAIGFEKGEEIYNHAIATAALCRALQRSPTKLLNSAAELALAYCLKAQNPNRAWKYGIRPGNNDSSVTGWMVAALHAAQEAGLDVPSSSLAGARAWFEYATQDETGAVGYSRAGGGSSYIPAQKGKFDEVPAMTAVGVLSRVLLGERRSASDIKRGRAILSRNLPARATAYDTRFVNLYYWYYGSYALKKLGGADWRAWSRALQQGLLPYARRAGCEDGSWDPVSEWSIAGGRVYMTAMAALCLEVYHRPLRVFQRAAAARPDPKVGQDKARERAARAAAEKALLSKARAWYERRDSLVCLSCKGDRLKRCSRCDGRGQVQVIGVGQGGRVRNEACGPCAGRGKRGCGSCKDRPDGLSTRRLKSAVKSYGISEPALSSFERKSIAIIFDDRGLRRATVSCQVIERGSNTPGEEVSIWSQDSRGDWRAQVILR